MVNMNLKVIQAGGFYDFGGFMTHVVKDIFYESRIFSTYFKIIL